MLNSTPNHQQYAGTTMSGAAPAHTSPTCDFCSRKGHSFPQCRKYNVAKTQVRKRKRYWARNTFPGTAPGPSATSESPTAQITTTTPSTCLWNVDTSATSHMMPHRYWLRDYVPLRVPIRLANNTMVYSEGVGNAVFKPIISGKRARAVELT